MLKPAIIYKDEIIKNIQKYFYIEDMMYETGSLDNWCPEISDSPNASNIQYAIVNKDNKLLGFLFYSIDWYTDVAHCFSLMSFDRGNPIIGKDTFSELERLIKKHHRVEWRAVSGNPACRAYDNFIKKHNGNKHILKDAIKDRDGNYHDDIIYEIVND